VGKGRHAKSECFGRTTSRKWLAVRFRDARGQKKKKRSEGFKREKSRQVREERREMLENLGLGNCYTKRKTSEIFSSVNAKQDHKRARRIVKENYSWPATQRGFKIWGGISEKRRGTSGGLDWLRPTKDVC